MSSRLRVIFERVPTNEIHVAAWYFAVAVAAWELTRIDSGIALLFPANGLVAAVWIRSARVRWYSGAILLLAASLLGNALFAHRPLPVALAFSALNGAEIAMMVLAFRQAVRYDYPDITIDQSAVMTAVLGIGTPGFVALLAGLMLNSHLGLAYGDGASQWWASHALGACLIAPPIILYSAKGLRRLTDPKFLAVNVATLFGVLLCCYVAIRFVRFPFVAIAVALLMAAVRLGGFGTAALSFCSGIAIAALWALGVRPLGLENVSVNFSLTNLPVLALLATTMPPIAVGLGTDARRAAVRKLHASEQRFRESMEHSPIGMLIASLDNVWGYTNIALQNMLGYTAEEFNAMPPGGPSEPEDWAGSRARWQRLLSGEVASYTVERRFRHKQGHWVWTHVAASLVRDEDGAPQYLIAQIESLEERRLAEAKLAEERQRLRITLMSINDAVVTTDGQARVSFINAAAESMLGLSQKQAQGRAVGEVLYLTDPLTSKAAANLIGQSAIHGKVMKREAACILHRADGSFCFVMDVVSPVLDSSGTVSGMVVVLRDASSEVRRAQDLTHRANHDALTDLHNRAAFEQHLAEVFGRSRMLDRPAALLAIDLDRFKALNDAAGHAAGDAALTKVAQACRATVRSSDMVARLGGDEFAIILDNCSRERADVLGQQILRALNPLQIEWQGVPYSIGASIGVAAWSADMSSEKDWMSAADRACYAAKRGGRGQLQMDSKRQSG
jgi:diguanylate cyclase (GGDEF)-like protein/PAS domain S-box-containing protein